MKTAWVTAKRTVELLDREYRKPGPGEVSVRIKACGLCGTDLHFFRDYPAGGPGAGSPTPLGHEVAGLVHETGPEVEGLAPGTEVIVQNHVSCGLCEACLNGRNRFCRNIRTYMNDRAGLAEYLTVDRRMVVPYRGLGFLSAALAEPLTVALDVVREAEIEPGQRVCVSGPGIIGLFCAMLARLSGAGHILVLGRGSGSPRGRRRLEAAAEMGADETADTGDARWTRGRQRSFHRVLVTSPPRTIPPLLDLACFGAVVVFNGISFGEPGIEFDANEFHFRKLQLRASHAIPNWGFPLAFDLLKSSPVMPKGGFDSLVTHRFPLDRLNEAFAAAESGQEEVVKVLIDL